MSDLSILLTSKEYAPYTKYWTEKLSSYREPFMLRAQGMVVKTGQQMDRLTFSLEPPQQEILTQLTQGRALETFIILLSGYYLLFAKYSGHCDIVIDSPLFNKGKVDNLLASKVSLLESLDFDNTLKELIIKVNQTVTQSYKYQNFPLAAVVQNESQVRTNVFISAAEIHHTTSTPLDDYDLIIEVKRSQFVLTYNTACFTEEFIQNMTIHYQNILGAYKNVSTCLKEVSLLSESEKHQVLVTFNNTQSHYPRDKSIVELFEAQVAKTPGATAIVFEDNALTYQTLNEKANQLAHYLRIYYHIQPDDFVAILLERSEWMIIAIYGILKAGGAYLPIEPDNPIARVQLMLDDSQAVVVLSHHVHVKQFQQAIDIERLFEETLSDTSKHNPTLVNQATDLAYVMYTSGSTGTPKGVLAEHRGVVRLVKNTNYTDLKPSDHILQLSNYAFDGSTFDIFGALLNGARLYLFPQALLLSVEQLCEFIAKNNINITFITTALFNKLVDIAPTLIAQFDKIYFGGQDASLVHIRTALQHRKQAEAIVHVYGPTEGTTFSTYYIIKEIPEGAFSVPIGAPISNSLVYILDEYLKPVPVGIKGEIYVSGDGIARGYLNNETLTANVFLDNPYVVGKRLYKTGDIGQWLPNGNIEFLGRRDEQVKIRGFRVELGEIENALLKYSAIQQAFVMARMLESGNKELVAYLVCKKNLTILDIRGYLAEMLPDYMIPAYFIPLDNLPLNANGKVDKHALPTPENASLDFGAYEEPRNEIEKQLIEIWQENLKRKPIGIHDNYFALGGDSIKAIQITTHLHQVNLKIDVRNIFLCPTIAELAETVVITKNSVIAQEVVSGIVPLTAVQTWFFEKYPQEKHFNQAVMLYSKFFLNFEALQLVFSKIQLHHDALRMRYRMEERQLIQENSGLDYPLSFENIDLRDSAAAVVQLTSYVETMQTSVDLEKGPLMKVALFHLQDGDRLFIIIHHLVVDGISWRILMEDIQNGYQQATQGENIELPAKTNSFKHWAEQILQYSNSQVLLEEQAYWQVVESTPVSLLPRDYLMIDDDDNLEQNIRSVEFNLSSTDTDTLLTQIHEAYRTEINDILLTALALTMYRWHGQSNTLITLEGHGRETIIESIDISRTVGWFTSMYPVVLILPIEKDLGYQIKCIKETLRNIPNKGIGYGILKYLTPSTKIKKLAFTQKPQISFNYLGQFDENIGSNLLTLAKESTGYDINPQAKRCHDLDIIGMVVQGQLQLSFAYNHKHYQAHTIECLAANYQQALLEIMEHCLNAESGDLTPSDIDYDGLDIDELDDILTQVTENS